MQCLAEGAANSACTSRYDDGFARDLHVSDRAIVVAATSQRPGCWRDLVRRPRICFSRARRWAGSPNNFKRLVNFLNLRKNAKIPLAGIGETDEIPVKLALEVGKRSPDRLSGGVSVIARVIEGLADGIYPGRAYADALISFLRGDGLVTIDVALVPHLARAVVDDALPAKITTIGHDDDRARVVIDLPARGFTAASC